MTPVTRPLFVAHQLLGGGVVVIDGPMLHGVFHHGRHPVDVLTFFERLAHAVEQAVLVPELVGADQGGLQTGAGDAAGVHGPDFDPLGGQDVGEPVGHLGTVPHPQGAQGQPALERHGGAPEIEQDPLAQLLRKFDARRFLSLGPECGEAARPMGPEGGALLQYAHA